MLCLYNTAEKKLRATDELRGVPGSSECFRFRLIYSHMVFQTDLRREEN